MPRLPTRWHVSYQDGATLMHHNHPSSEVHTMVDSGCCVFSGFGQMYNDTYPIINIAEYFHCFTILCACRIHPSPPFFFPGNCWSFYCLLEEHQIVRIIVCSVFRSPCFWFRHAALRFILPCLFMV